MWTGLKYIFALENNHSAMLSATRFKQEGQSAARHLRWEEPRESCKGVMLRAPACIHERWGQLKWTWVCQNSSLRCAFISTHISVIITSGQRLSSTGHIRITKQQTIAEHEVTWSLGGANCARADLSKKWWCLSASWQAWHGGGKDLRCEMLIHVFYCPFDGIAIDR